MEISPLYFESHVTIDPSEQVEKLRGVCEPLRYKVAELYMRKGGNLTISDLDQFMTGHSKDIEDLKERQSSLLVSLIHEGFQVRRYKIEAVLQDSRYLG